MNIRKGNKIWSKSHVPFRKQLQCQAVPGKGRSKRGNWQTALALRNYHKNKQISSLWQHANNFVQFCLSYCQNWGQEHPFPPLMDGLSGDPHVYVQHALNSDSTLLPLQTCFDCTCTHENINFYLSLFCFSQTLWLVAEFLKSPFLWLPEINKIYCYDFAGLVCMVPEPLLVSGVLDPARVKI